MAMGGAGVSGIGTVAVGSGGLTAAPGLAVALATAVATGAVCVLASEMIVFRPLRRSAARIPLIASIGLAIAIAEGVRLLQGAGDLWIPGGPAEVLTVASNAGFEVSQTTRPLWLVAAPVLAVTGVVLLIGRPPFGPRYPALSQDPDAPAPPGVDPSPGN